MDCFRALYWPANTTPHEPILEKPVIQKSEQQQEQPMLISPTSLFHLASRVASHDDSFDDTTRNDTPSIVRPVYMVTGNLALPTVFVLDPDPLKIPTIEVDMGRIEITSRLLMREKMPPAEIRLVSEQLLENSVDHEAVVFHLVGNFTSGGGLSRNGKSMDASVKYWSDLTMPMKRLHESTCGRLSPPQRASQPVSQPKRFFLIDATIPDIQIHPKFWRALSRNRRTRIPGIDRVVPLGDSKSRIFDYLVTSKRPLKRTIQPQGSIIRPPLNVENDDDFPWDLVSAKYITKLRR